MLREKFNITMVIREKLTDMKVNQGSSITNMTEEMELEEEERVQEKKATEEEIGEVIDILRGEEKMKSKVVKNRKQKNSQQILNKLLVKLKLRSQEKIEEGETMIEMTEEERKKLLKKRKNLKD